MTVVQPNSIAGINSITVQSGNALAIHKSDGTLIQNIVGATGVSTFSSISVGSATTTNSAGKSINIGLGASISQHADNTLSFGTNGIEALRIDSSKRLLLNKTSGSFHLEVGAGSDSTFRITNLTESSHGDVDAKIVAGGSYYQNPNIVGSAIKFTTYNGSSEGERARIASNGNVRIGPAGAPNIAVGGGLEIEQAGAATLRLEDTGAGSGFEIQNTGGVIKQRLYNNQPWTIEYGGGEKLRIKSDGKVGINTTTPYSALEVQGDGGVNDATITFTRHGTPANNSVIGSNFYRIGTDSVAGIGAYRESAMDDAYLAFHTQPTGGNYTERLRIQSGGDVLIGTTTSAGKLTVDSGTSNTCATFQSSDAGAGINVKDNHARSSIEQNGTTLKISADTGGEYANSDIRLQVDGGTKMKIDSSGHITPGADGTQDLGSISSRWANIYSADLQLSNEGSQNDVDGSWGTYTIQEGESDLFLINRRNGKKYKFNLTEVS